MFLYTLRLLQSLTYGDKLKCFQFCGNLKFANLQEEDGFLEKLIYGDESPFHISGKVNKYNVGFGVAQTLEQLLNMSDSLPN